MKPFITCFFLLFALQMRVFCQNDAGSISFTKAGSFEYSGFYSCYSSLFDRNGQSYLYSASAVLGLVVFDIADLQHPTPIDTLPSSLFHNLNVNNVFQSGDYLYLALGSFQGTTQKAGLAILDVSNPTSISVVSAWDSATYKQGCAVVRADGQYAYLGAMEDGIIILDISDKSNPTFVSQFQPDPSFPGVANYAPNARGMEIRNNILYLAYDAGGLRLIDISDKQHPKQIAQYANNSLTANALPAYNNIQLVGNYAFITVDYCGLEIVDISNPNNIYSVQWYNPWNCMGASWFGSPGHANELITAAHDSLLFVSGGDSEVLALDISNPMNIKELGAYAFPKDSAATWGVDVLNNRVALSFIDNSGFPLFQPFYSNFGGIEILTWERATTTPVNNLPTQSGKMDLFPNPMTEQVTLRFESPDCQQIIFEIFNSAGKLMDQFSTQAIAGENKITLPTQKLPAGIYFFKMISERGTFYSKAIKS